MFSKFAEILMKPGSATEDLYTEAQAKDVASAKVRDAETMADKFRNAGLWSARYTLTLRSQRSTRMHSLQVFG